MRQLFSLATLAAIVLCLPAAPAMAHGKKTPHKHDKKGKHKKGHHKKGHGHGHGHGPEKPKGPKELRGVTCPAGEWKAVRVPRKADKAMSLEATVRWMTPLFVRAATLMDTTAQLTERDPSRLDTTGIQTNVEGYRYFDKHKAWPKGKAPDSFLIRVCGDELKALFKFAAREWDKRPHPAYRKALAGRDGIDAKRFTTEQYRFMELAISAYKQHHYAVKWLTTQTGTTHLPTTSLRTLERVAAKMRVQAAEFLALAERSKRVAQTEKAATTAAAGKQACTGTRAEWFYTQKCVTRRKTLNAAETGSCKTWKTTCNY